MKFFVDVITRQRQNSKIVVTMQHDMLDISSQQDGGKKILNDPDYSKIEIQEKGPCQNLLDLPLELQVKIFEEYLNPQDQFQIRQVHSRFQVLFDDYIGFTVKIDEDDQKEKLEFLSEIAIRKATIVNMVNLKDIEDGQLKPPIFENLFIYPQYIKSILVLGSVQHIFLNDMIRNCRVVDVFELSSASFIDNKSKEFCDVEILPEIDILSLQPAKITFFPMCKTLKLLLKDTIITSSREVHTEAVLKLMKTTQSPFLERVVMQCWSTERYPVSRISLISAECLERNPSIRSYFVGILYDSDQQNDEESIGSILSRDDEELRDIAKSKLIKASRQMTVEKLGISTTAADMVLWKEFIKYQSNLVHISLTVDVGNGVFTNEMFISSQKTLRQFVLRGKFFTTFDFMWLEDCEKLKEICLHNITDGEVEGSSVHTVNVSSIPAGVESLVLFQTVARTDEINVALRKLKQLDTLVLFKIGNTAGETGIDPTCLKLILNTRTLQSILLVRFVASSPDQASELVKILQDMHYEENGNNEETDIDLVEVLGDIEIDVPPPLAAIEDQVAGSSAKVEIPSNLVSEATAVFVEDALQSTVMVDQNVDLKRLKEPCELTTLCLNLINNNNSTFEKLGTSTTATSNEVSSESDKEIPAETSTDSASNINDLDYSCATGIPEHKMEPNLLPETDTTISKNNDLQDEGASYNSKGSENLQPQSDAKEHAKEETKIETSDPSQHIFASSNVIESIDEFMEDEWEDINDSDDSDEDDESLWGYNFHDPGFVVGMDNDNDVALDVVGQAENGQDFQLILNLENEEDLENMLGLLEPAGENNVAFGFIIDGVIDIMNKDTKRSRWVAVEDDDGHLTYTLKITID